MYSQEEWRRQRRIVLILTVIAGILMLCFGWIFPEVLRRQEQKDLREALITCSNVNHGETLDEVIKNLRRYPFETMVFFDGKMNKLLETSDGNQDNVRLDNGLAVCLSFFDDITFVHNHPGGDTTFSGVDLYFPCAEDMRTQIRSLIVVSPNYLYQLELRGEAWPSQDEMWDFVAGLIDDDRYCDKIMVDGEQKQVFNDLAIECVAEEFDLVYSVTRLQ